MKPGGDELQLMAGDIAVLQAALPENPVMEKIADRDNREPLTVNEVRAWLAALQAVDAEQLFGDKMYFRTAMIPELAGPYTMASLIVMVRDVLAEGLADAVTTV
ncbi:hypothetical protein KA093_02910 [Candidatus Saccharibacteria bacterium]|nr:hypothetical protein [Candidatus Saccharibacteria bacterium]